MSFKTSHLGLAAALITTKVPFNGMEPDDDGSGRQHFAFDGHPAIMEEYKRAYFAGELLVSASGMYNAFKDLKTQLHERA
jgi:hypothetical protein